MSRFFLFFVLLGEILGDISYAIFWGVNRPCFSPLLVLGNPQAAGGKVVVAQTGQELTYGKPRFENPGFIAVSEKEILQGKAN